MTDKDWRTEPISDVELNPPGSQPIGALMDTIALDFLARLIATESDDAYLVATLRQVLHATGRGVNPVP